MLHYTLCRSGVLNFVSSAGHFEFFWESSSHTFKNQVLQVTLLQQIQAPNTETLRGPPDKMSHWAGFGLRTAFCPPLLYTVDATCRFRSLEFRTNFFDLFDSRTS